ncbi:berberine bridge enzyme-like 23 [Coffea eugenioides]|uniref:berberine bridge enzyme-like 23 n=1 Tax=Coffea eugenioides TaxID=49369 RepID=UPI000F60E943|nr:berberine bridge enzyme-like 23 [Coffea eugenioides]
MSKIREIDVDLKNQTAWVGTGAILAGVCPSVGIGGHFSGGGQGMLTRKYGLAADNVIDAVIVDAQGRIIDRNMMGEDLFWAIRGGGAASFGVVVKWKIKLVPVPPIVTTLYHIPKIISIQIGLHFNSPDLVIFTSETWRIGQEVVSWHFDVEGLSVKKEFSPDLLTLKETDPVPELSEDPTKCWLKSALFFYFYEAPETVEDLIDRNHYPGVYFKAKSDNVTLPIKETSLDAIWDVFKEGTPGSILLQPYGGIFNEIPRSQTPFPHRAGTLYNVHYYAMWHGERTYIIKERLDWLHRIYDFMGDFVEKPRTAYQITGI